MKKLFASVFCLALLVLASSSFADDRLKPYQSINEFTTLAASGAASGDYLIAYDASANLWKKVDARAALTAFNGTVGATTPAAGAFTTLSASSTLGVTGAATFSSTIGGAGNVTLDDGSGASPSLTFTDATDETAVFSKADSGFLSVTTVAADGFNVLTGNLKVGNGTPDVAQNGEDAYVEGTLEVDGATELDGALNVDGALTATSTAGFSGAVSVTGSLKGPFEDTTATNVLTAAECGKTIMLNSATEFVTTLPAPVAGCTFKFIVKAAPSSASYTVVTDSSSNILIGHVETADIDGAGDGDSSTADDTITFADGVAAVGDMVEMSSDGTSWYYIGHAKTYNGITGSAT